MLTTGAPAVAVRDVRRSYGATVALDGVSLTVERGEVVALLGHNGAGKSTLAKIVAGAVRPDEGSVEVGGRLLRARPADALALGVRCIYQHRTLLPNLSVAENVAFLERRGLRRHRRQATAMARQRLTRLGCHVPLDVDAGALGPLEAQEVEIARALDEDITLLVLDEPTASLSAHEVDQLTRTMRQLASAGIGLLLISHDLDHVERVADRAVVLRNGRVSYEGVVRPGSRDGLVAAMLGAVAEPTPHRTAHRRQTPVLRVLDAPTRDGARVSLDVVPGEVVGVTGVMGSGTRELARLLGGVTRPPDGTLELDGQVTRVRSPRDAVRHGIVYLSDDRAAAGLFPNLLVRRQMGLVRQLTGRLLGPIGRRRERREAGETADAVNLPRHRLGLLPGQLSGGNQQKVVIGRCLDAEPRVLVAHEPTVGVDVKARADIHRQLLHLADGGAAVVVISSDTEELVAIAERLVVLRNGAIAIDTYEPLDEQQLLAHATGGSTA